MYSSTRTYTELMKLSTFEERFRYLRLGSLVGYETFGNDRYLNQQFYTSKIWKDFRRKIILRDNGCDLGIADRPISDRIVIHHLNPVTIEDILQFNWDVVNPEFVICTSELTHKAIHYSDEKLLPKGIIERKPNDTCPWK